MRTFGQFLSQLIAERGLSQQKLADIAGVSLNTIWRAIHRNEMTWRAPTATMVFHALDGAKPLSGQEVGEFFDGCELPSLGRKIQTDRADLPEPASTPPRRGGSLSDTISKAREALPESTAEVTARCYHALSDLLHTYPADLVLAGLESTRSLLDVARRAQPRTNATSGVRAIHSTKHIDGADYHIITPVRPDQDPASPSTTTRPSTQRRSGT